MPLPLLAMKELETKSRLWPLGVTMMPLAAPKLKPWMRQCSTCSSPAWIRLMPLAPLLAA